MYYMKQQMASKQMTMQAVKRRRPFFKFRNSDCELPSYSERNIVDMNSSNLRKTPFLNTKDMQGR